MEGCGTVMLFADASSCVPLLLRLTKSALLWLVPGCSRDSLESLARVATSLGRIALNRSWAMDARDARWPAPAPALRSPAEGLTPLWCNCDCDAHCGMSKRLPLLCFVQSYSPSSGLKAFRQEATQVVVIRRVFKA